ncbi:MAG: DNA polymerase IV [Actinomycetaceae bacterium]|nr:DNA polymerase IV [Arcanobacterium sp.]MDD7504832.1 DNA polymerase IV [Actinomycetaceae bacterium]MDY6142778.1 DNA polymerase IV [Arcanobacterium sp.]
MSRAPRAKNLRTNWGDDDAHTPILHVDMDAFFVSCELRDRPELRGRAVAVGGQRRGVISAASYEAREYGVNSAMPVARALQLCPELIILPVDSAKYRAASSEVMRILRRFTPVVEQLSIDEAFLDVRSVRKIHGSPVEIAQQIRHEIRDRIGVPASVGIASTKHLAKLASTHAKPDGLLLVPASRSIEFLHSLPVGALWGVGERTRALLESRGFQTVGDVARAGCEAMIAMLGPSQGEHLSNLAMNIDPRGVATTKQEKSISRERTFFEPIVQRGDVVRVLLDHSHDVARRLRQEGLQAASFSIKIRGGDFATIQRSTTLNAPTARGHDVFDAVVALWDTVEFPRSGVRLVGVRASQLVDAAYGQQLPLGDDGRQDRIDAAVDALRSRFGPKATQPGTLIDSVQHRHLDGQ